MNLFETLRNFISNVVNPQDNTADTSLDQIMSDSAPADDMVEDYMFWGFWK